MTQLLVINLHLWMSTSLPNDNCTTNSFSLLLHTFFSTSLLLVNHSFCFLTTGVSYDFNSRVLGMIQLWFLWLSYFVVTPPIHCPERISLAQFIILYWLYLRPVCRFVSQLADTHSSPMNCSRAKVRIVWGGGNRRVKLDGLNSFSAEAVGKGWNNFLQRGLCSL